MLAQGIFIRRIIEHEPPLFPELSFGCSTGKNQDRNRADPAPTMRTIYMLGPGSSINCTTKLAASNEN